jgi:hypothetical protein
MGLFSYFNGLKFCPGTDQQLAQFRSPIVESSVHIAQTLKNPLTNHIKCGIIVYVRRREQQNSGSA